MYCTNKFKKSHTTTRDNKEIYASFEALELEIKKLQPIAQINLYSAATQFLLSLSEDPHDAINPLEVFIYRCDSIIGKNDEAGRKIILALGAIALSLSMMALGAALGVGIGMMLGLWNTPLVFMSALLGTQTAPLVVALTSVSAGIGTGLIAQFMFFKEPGIKTALNHCVETIKQSHLSETKVIEEEQEGHTMEDSQSTSTSSQPFH